MQRAIGFVQQAGAAFDTRQFTKAAYLLRRSLRVLPVVWPYSQPLRWTLLDALEMIDSWYQGLLVLEHSAHSEQLLQSLPNLLTDTTTAVNDWKAALKALDVLLEGIWMGFDFFENNNLWLEQQPLLLSWQLDAEGSVRLYRWQTTPLVEALVAEFEACFVQTLEHAAQYQQALEDLVTQQDWPAAEALLQEQLERFPSDQCAAFLGLGEVYFQQARYQKAMEAYMKAVVMGTPKSQVRAHAQTACNALAREAETSKAAARWRKVLIDFF